MTPRRAAATALYVVDRREGDTVVVVDDQGNSTDLAASELPRSACAEGAVLRVPRDARGAPRWSDAVRDRGEERRRRAEVLARIERLRRGDPGGDIEL